MRSVKALATWGCLWARMACMVCVLCLVLPVAAGASLHHKVLLISSYHPSFPTFFKQVEGIRSVLDPAGIVLDVEFMDSKRFPDKDSIALFSQSLRHKLQKLGKYDAVITADDNALTYALAHQVELFPHTPIIFCGVNNQNLGYSLSRNELVTGVLEAPSIAETLRLIMRVLPDTDSIYVVVDGTPSGQHDLASLSRFSNLFPGETIHILSLEKLSWREMADSLHLLPSRSALLLLSAYRDSENQHKSFREAVAFLYENSANPIFHLWEHGVGRGLLGGKVVSHYEQGKKAASMAFEIIHGVTPSELAVVKGDSVNPQLFDYKELERFAIDESLLPKDSRVINLPERKNDMSLVRTLLLLIAVLSAMNIAVAVCYLRMRKKYKS